MADAGAVTGTPLPLDLRALFSNVNATNFIQGNSSRIDTASSDVSDTFTRGWSVLPGSRFGMLGTCNVSGTYAAVPVAAWLMGSGLPGSIGVARRRATA